MEKSILTNLTKMLCILALFFPLLVLVVVVAGIE